MVAELSAGVKTLVFNLVIISYAGTEGVAAIAILMHLYFLMSSFHIGLSLGISPVVSFNYGSRNFPKIRELVRTTVMVAMGVSVGCFVLAMGLGENAIRLFTRDQLAVAAIAENGLAIFAFTFLINGINFLSSGFFTSVNNGKISAFPTSAVDKRKLETTPISLGIRNNYHQRTRILNTGWHDPPMTIIVVREFGNLDKT